MSSSSILSAGEIAERVRARELSPVEVVETHLERIAALNAKLNAFVHVNEDSARESARRLEREMAEGRSGPLCGVPVSIKSSIDVAGLRCEAGSRLSAGRTPAADAPLVQRLRAAGAIVLGTTNTPEMLVAYETDNLLYGRTCNPWNPARTAGGSSGGEAAAIASGMSAAGIGSDGGGSIRVPAHFTGICGLKPTPGRIPATGHTPECAGPWAFLGVVGPMARTVADLRLLWEVLAGPDDGDPMAAPIAEQPGESLVGARIAWLEDAEATAETRAALERAAQRLQTSGAVVESIRIAGFEQALELWEMVFCRAGSVMVRAAAGNRSHLLSPIVRDFLAYVDSRPPLSVESLLAGLVERDRVRASVLRQLRAYAAVLAPVSSGPAFAHGEGGWGASHPADYLQTMRCSQFANVMGLPALSVPAGFSAEGLPIGAQLIGLPYSEARLLQLAAAIESRWTVPPVTSSGSAAAR